MIELPKIVDIAGTSLNTRYPSIVAVTISKYWNGANTLAGALPAAQTINMWPIVAASPIHATHISCWLVGKAKLVHGISNIGPTSKIKPNVAVADKPTIICI